MRMNRRNVLFVLGTTILLGGALIASGAFSQVEAQRDVSVETTGDADAALGISLNSSYTGSSAISYSNGSDGELGLKFTKVNGNATTYYDDVLDIENNDEGVIKANVSSNSDSIMVYTGETRTYTTGNKAELTSIGTSDTKSVGLALNSSKFSSSDDVTITINATKTSN
ncbi:hypothetical protein [Natrinema halophilum]|uniref:DUF1102 domain-containing protein n=1 Tax=Natrinema halophilum TaxID=1699371 RepID=A0A7D5KRG6_9EURY|nr:hypothetical protein [Natrinema halophilum]QLG49317.1 hypothetical protein HYG82_10810 [Natrinema halophilum]